MYNIYIEREREYVCIQYNMHMYIYIYVCVYIYIHTDIVWCAVLLCSDAKPDVGAQSTKLRGRYKPSTNPFEMMGIWYFIIGVYIFATLSEHIALKMGI